MIFRDKEAHNNYAIVKNIVCETISVDCLIANHIKAKNVSLKFNCIVDLLEYTNTLIMDKNCKVKNIGKIESGEELWKKAEEKNGFLSKAGEAEDN